MKFWYERMLVFKSVNFCCEDEIAFSESVDFVCPNVHSHFAPREVDVRVMALFLGEATDSIGEGERGDKVIKDKFLLEMMTANSAPFCADLCLKFSQYCSLQRWHAASAGNALLLG